MANPTARVQNSVVTFLDRKHRRGVDAAAATYYPGEHLGVDADGYVRKCDDTVALDFCGLVAESHQLEKDADTDGTTKIDCELPNLFSAKIASAARTDIGKKVYALYSDEVSYNPGTYGNFIGWVEDYIDSTHVLIRPRWAPGNDSQPRVIVTSTYSAPADNDVIFTADRRYLVRSIEARVRTVASDGSAVTASLKKAASGTAITAGTLLHTATELDLKGTANTNQTLTLTATVADRIIADGTSIGLDVTGTTTAAVGTITIVLEPLD